eukprot:1151408-Pelagomonas_calceolata.AAC.6
MGVAGGCDGQHFSTSIPAVLDRHAGTAQPRLAPAFTESKSKASHKVACTHQTHRAHEVKVCSETA